MKVLHLSSTGIRGGAGVAAGRLHASLRHLGVDSKLLSLDGILVDEKTLLPFTQSAEFYRALDLELAQHVLVDANRTEISNTLFSLGLPGPNLHQHPEVISADILHLHWINGLLGIPAIAAFLASGKPVVWTVHDQWPFTGGCHYSAGCDNYTTGCTSCPQLRQVANKLPRAVFEDKFNLWTARNSVTIVALTEWMESCIRKSLLFQNAKITRIPNGLDLTIFSPGRREAARSKLGLGADTIVFLFASQTLKERRKGYLVFKEALHLALKKRAFRRAIEAGQILFAYIGHDTDADSSVPLQHWGWITDDSTMADCYAAADVFLAPALEDNLPNTVVESLACGTPVIGSSAGGIPEMVIPGRTGAIFPSGNVELLAKCLGDVWLRPERYSGMRDNCRIHAETHYSGRVNAAAMIRLYQELITATSHQAQEHIAKLAGESYGPAVKGALFDPSLEEVWGQAKGKTGSIVRSRSRRSPPAGVTGPEGHLAPGDSAGADASRLLGRQIQAKIKAMEADFAAVEKDRIERGRVIKEQGQRLSHLEAEFDRRLQELTALYAAADALKNERNHLQAQLADLQKNFNLVEKDRAERGRIIERQGAEHSELQGQFAARLKELAALYASVDTLRNERNLLEARLAELQGHFAAVEADRAARGKVIDEQGRRVVELEKMVWLTEQNRDYWKNLSQKVDPSV